MGQSAKSARLPLPAETIKRLMRWKSLCRPSEKSCHKNTSVAANGGHSLSKFRTFWLLWNLGKGWIICLSEFYVPRPKTWGPNTVYFRVVFQHICAYTNRLRSIAYSQTHCHGPTLLHKRLILCRVFHLPSVIFTILYYCWTGRLSRMPTSTRANMLSVDMTCGDPWNRPILFNKFAF